MKNSEYDVTKESYSELFMFGEKTWGLVLSGGGGKGAYEVGAMKAILEKGAKITAVSGASVGALNAALFATYDIHSIVEIWHGIHPKVALSQEGLERLIWGNAIPWMIENSNIPCYVNAYNIQTGKNEDFCLNDYKGQDIVKLLLASAAMPILYPPVFFGNSLYWDGGLLDNTPIEVLYQRGYRNLIVVYLNPETQKDSYKNADIISFAPTEKWGFLDGTLNFEPEDIRKRIEQGYRETKWRIEYINKTDSLF